MQSFEIGLKDNRQNRYLNFMLFCILLNVMLFAWILSTSVHSFILFAGLIFVLIMLIVHVTKNWKRLSSPPHYFLMIMVISWMLNFEWLPAILNLIFIFSGEYLSKKIKILVDQSGILIQSYPKKIFEWKDADNMLIKDGLLTIDLLNNKLFQLPVEHTSINENDFNAFCAEQIQQHKTD